MATTYVARDGTGNYNCDGVKDQVQINQALAHMGGLGGGVVYLKSGLYMIDGRIEIPNNIHLTGDTGAKIMLVPRFPLPTSDWSLITGTGAIGRQFKTGYNIEISNITISSNRFNQNWVHSKTDETPTINIRGRNLKFHNLRFKDGLGDFIKIQNSNELQPNVEIYNNYFGRSGHDAIYILYTGATGNNRVHIHDNELAFVAANAGIRLDSCSGVIIENNSITTNNQGDMGIYIVYKYGHPTIGSKNNIVRYNKIYNTREGGIFLVALDPNGRVNLSETGGNKVHNNLIYNTKYNTGSDNNGGGIIVYGHSVDCENNTIVGCEGSGIVVKSFLIPGYMTLTNTTGFKINSKNNIIVNQKTVGIFGYGIHNTLPTQHTINSSYDCIWGNARGHYGGNVNYSNNIHVNPLFVDLAGNDYHLAPGSPCIDAGDPTSDYSGEPEPNGGRIDMGRYGGTSAGGTIPEPDPEPTKIHYVDIETGNDDNTGLGGWINAFKTIERAATVVQPGEEVKIAVGDYSLPFGMTFPDVYPASLANAPRGAWIKYAFEDPNDTGKKDVVIGVRPEE